MTASLRRLALSAGLVAAAFALKYPLIAVPNVEPLTLAFFSIGFVYGPVWGLIVGAAGETFYATFNPLGVPILPVWAAQIVGMGMAGVMGGWLGLAARRFRSQRPPIVLVVSAGVAATLSFDTITNLAFALAIGPFRPVIIAAAPFAAIHVVSNALLFASIFPILHRWLSRPASVVVPPAH